MDTTQERDQRLRRTVERSLATTCGDDAVRIAVAVTDEAITLAGEALTFADKHRAVSAALTAPGVSTVVDTVTVANGYGPLQDTEIARRVAAALAEVTGAGAVRAIVRDRCVTLCGSADGSASRRQAHEAIVGLGIAHQVFDCLDSTSPPDTIAAAVRQALRHHDQLRATTIEAGVDQLGVVTLHGRVLTEEQRRLATDAAWAVDGVVGVQDELELAL